MTTPVQAPNVQQGYPAYDFKPSYNAVQLNLAQPTLNVPPTPPAPPAPPVAEGQKSWIA